jgi:hypothetical protein
MVNEITAYAYVYCQTQNDQHLQHTTNVTTFIYNHLVLNVTFSKKKRAVY